MTYGPEHPVPLLGPCRCIGCGEPLYWAARNTRRMGITILKTAWREDDGTLHRCPEWESSLARARAKWDNTGAGDGCVSVPYALTPVSRPSPDEPGSFASIEVMAR